MAKNIEISLKTKDIKDLITYLNSYSDLITSRVDWFVRRLMNEIAIPVIDNRYNTATGDSDKSHKTYLEITLKTKDVYIAKVVTEGKDILFLEFGAGIYYNNGNAHPDASRLGYGVGTYPNQVHAFQDEWWYNDENGNLHLSKGTKATMGMYYAELEIIKNVERIAKEVFSQ